MKFASALISAIAAVTAVSAYGGSGVFARDLAELDARDAYELGFLHARGLYEDDDFELYAREAMNRPGQ